MCVFVLIGVCSILFLITLKCCVAFLNNDEYDVWLTTGDQSKKLSREQPIGVTSSPHGYSVWVDRNKRRQTIEGFGAALTNSAAYNLFHSKIRDQIMTDLFGSSGLGIDTHILFYRNVATLVSKTRIIKNHHYFCYFCHAAANTNTFETVKNYNIVAWIVIPHSFQNLRLVSW